MRDTRKLEAGWEAGGRRKAMSMRDVGIQGGSINGDKQDVGGKGGGEEAKDFRTSVLSVPTWSTLKLL